MYYAEILGVPGPRGARHKSLAGVLPSAWERLMASQEKHARICMDNLLVGFLERDGRLYDAEKRQLAVIINPRLVFLTIGDRVEAVGEDAEVVEPRSIDYTQLG